VVDEDNEPVFRIRVAALRPSYSRGGRELLQPRASITTDDQGNFRLGGLAAGLYYVQANGLNGGNPMFGLNRGASYSETYYPEAHSPGDAQRIRVVGGAEVRGLHIAVTTQSAHTISGKVVDASGDAGGRTYQLFITRVGADAMVFPGGDGVRADGSFIIRGVPQGDYTVGVRAMDPAPDSTNSSRRQQSGYGTARVHIADADVKTDIEVGPLAELRGAATIESTQNLSSLTSLGIMLLSAGPTGQGGASSTLAEDGTFDVKDIAPGEYTFMAFGPQSSAYLQRAQCGGTDYTVQPITIGAGDGLSDCVLTLANDTGTLSGQVMDGETPVPNLVVVAIPQLRSLRKNASYTATVKTDSGGKFQLNGIIPGDYEVFAVPADADQPYYALDFPEQNQNSAQRVTIKPRETQTVTLKPTNPQ